MEDQLLETLKCPICLGYAQDPLGCNYCHNLFCQKCITEEDKTMKISKCPMCQNEPSYKESLFAKRLVDNIILVPCPNNCNISISRTDLKEHFKICENRVMKCNLCEFTGRKTEFIEHVYKTHESELIERFDKSDINSKKMINKNGQQIYIGTNGKFYCKQKSDVKCKCCDGNCGPDNGCNCSAYMKTHCQMLNLQQGMLINNCGIPSKLYQNNLFYCGRTFKFRTGFLFIKHFTDAVCLPPSQCEECLILTQIQKYYLSEKI